MSLQYFCVFDSATGNPKRYGTCDHIDVDAQASEPNEIAMVCPPEHIQAIQASQAAYEAKPILDRQKPFVTPFKVEMIGAVPIIAAQAK